MWIPHRLSAGFARQLGHPAGLRGKVVGRILNRFNGPLVDAAVEAAGITAGQTVADVGFGGGVGLSLLLNKVGPDGRVFGIDTSATMLDMAEHRFYAEIAAGRISLHDADMQHLPMANDSVDAVISTNTLYYVDDPAPGLREIARVLRPGGRAVIGVGDPVAMSKLAFSKPGGLRLRPINELVDGINAAGLRYLGDQRVGASERAFHLLVCAP